MIGMRVRSKVWLERDGRFVVGDGGLQLLRGIERLGSLTAAARTIGWSYRHAWDYLRHAQEVLGIRVPLMVALILLDSAGRPRTRKICVCTDLRHRTIL